ncbi:mucin-17 [Paramisgurnus dabryanus]|uniref:mucin-17 n=1 Tax=Paramisgurnus dabryanus TaxID=90735 RepID=UPI0031F37CB3
MVNVGQPFVPEYNNTSSDKYKKFVSNFKSKMEPYYKEKVPNFNSMEIRKLSEGKTKRRRSLALTKVSRSSTVIVHHDVMVDISNDNNFNSSYYTSFKEVKSALDALKGTDDIIDVDAFETELNVTEVCDAVTAILPEEYRKYYAPSILPGKVMCVSQCHQGHPHPKMCFNNATCEVSFDGPSCYCLNTDVSWYLGEDCSYKVNKIGFYAGTGVVALILVITIAVLTAYVVINKRKVSRSKDIKRKLVNKWLEDDVEWPTQRNTLHSVSRGPHDNPTFSQENSYRRDSSEIYRPNLSEDQTDSQYSIPETDIQPYNFQRDVRIDRPQIRSSSEI